MGEKIKCGKLKDMVFLEKVMKKIREMMPVEEIPICTSWGNSKVGVSIYLDLAPCAWFLKAGGCVMCGYSKRRPVRKLTEFKVLESFKKELVKYDFKKFNNTLELLDYSIFDEKEVSQNIRKKIFKEINQYSQIKRVNLETRAEFVNTKPLEETKGLLSQKEVVVYMGLETTNDFVREYCINKGMTLKEFIKSIGLIKKSGLKTGAFVLLKPPFLTEGESIKDCVNSIKQAFKIGVDEVQLMVCTIELFTLTDWLLQKKLYRAPWLWSIIEVLKSTDEPGKIFGVFGHRRGKFFEARAHNCGSCDEKVSKLIDLFNQQHKVNIFNKVNCTCKKAWLEELQNPSRPLIERLKQNYTALSREFQILLSNKEVKKMENDYKVIFYSLLRKSQK